MEIANKNFLFRILRIEQLKEPVLSFYIFIVLILVLSIILGQTELVSDNPGYEVYDCKHSINSCNQLLKNNKNLDVKRR